MSENSADAESGDRTEQKSEECGWVESSGDFIIELAIRPPGSDDREVLDEWIKPGRYQVRRIPEEGEA